MELEYNGIQLYIPERYAIEQLLSRFKHSSYEKEEVTLIKYLDSKDRVLELGSCLGYLSICMAKKVESVIGIEANPELIDSLNKTKQMNKQTNIDFIHGIIDENEEEKEFYTYDLIVAGSADRSDHNTNAYAKSKKSYKVKCMKIEEIKNKPNVLVIDIEGGELDFLEKTKFYIKKYIDKIIIELHGRFMSDREFNKKCIQTMEECGLRVKEQKGESYYLEKFLDN